MKLPADSSPPSPADVYRAFAEEALARWLPRDAPSFGPALQWVLSRYEEGASMGRLLRERLGPGRLRVLDLGAGNGGATLGLAAEGLGAVACDCYLNGEIVELRRRTGVPFAHAVGAGQALPFAAASFDAVLLLDVIEHVPRVEALGAEVARVVRRGGIVVVTTPPRVRFLLRPDPHHAIMGLALLPAPLQRLVAERILKRTDRYDVAHLYWSVRGIAAAFPTGAFSFQALGGQRKWRRLGLDWDRLVGARH